MTPSKSLADAGLMSATEVARLLKMSRRFVYDAAQNGRLRAIRFGNRVRFEIGEVEAFVERCRAQPRPTGLKHR